MAESAVTFVLQMLGSLLGEEMKLLRGIYREVKCIKDEFSSMRAFLKDADGRGENEEVVKDWVKQVREVVYDTEDVIDDFALLAQRCQSASFLEKTTGFVKNLKERLRIATQIRDIKVRLIEISGRRNCYGFNSVEQGSSSNSRSDIWHDSRGDALLIDEAELVGIEKPRETLIKWLVKGEPRLGVVSVVGMGGLGKTTIVKKVSDDQRVKGYFSHHAWITVSQSFKIEELLRDLIAQLFGKIKQSVPRDMETMKDDRLRETLKTFLLQKRYVIVFDDIWSLHVWDAVKYALPNNSCGSRILITTRFADIASSCMQFYGGYVYNLEILPPKESWDLFCKKVFRSNLVYSCPAELEKPARNILRKCEGLPLAIVAIAGLLSTKAKNFIEWDTVCRSLSFEVVNNEKLVSMKKILLLSFNDLPYYLKACFMYLSIFPEDYLIDRMRLIRLWVVEGFVEEEEGKTIEEVADSYLYDLINRNLLQVALRDRSGKVKRWQVHDLVRDIILSKANEDDFCAIVNGKNTIAREKVRHLAILTSSDEVAQKNGIHHLLSRLRSLFLFGIHRSPNSYVEENFFSGFRHLKVIDLRGAQIETFPNGITNLFHLRYLSMRKTKIKTVPNSIEGLLNLETLDLKQTNVSQLPVGILKLKKLRHLLVYRYDKESYLSFDHCKGFTLKVDIGSLVSLQKLSCIEAGGGKGTIRELGRLNQLRRLGIVKLRTEHGIDVCLAIQKMTNLRSFSVTLVDEKEVFDLKYLSSFPPLLQRLYLQGRLEKLPHWISSLDNLVKLKLRWSRLSDDPLEALQDLPSLEELELRQAYEGKILCFMAGTFQRLKVLTLNKLEGLQVVKVEEGAMCSLQKLDIRRCRLLQNVASGIERLAHIDELRFYDMPEEFRRRLLPDGGEDHWRVAHIPAVHFIYWRDGNWERCRL